MPGTEIQQHCFSSIVWKEDSASLHCAPDLRHRLVKREAALSSMTVLPFRERFAFWANSLRGIVAKEVGHSCHCCGKTAVVLPPTRMLFGLLLRFQYWKRPLLLMSHLAHALRLKGPMPYSHSKRTLRRICGLFEFILSHVYDIVVYNANIYCLSCSLIGLWVLWSETESLLLANLLRLLVVRLPILLDVAIKASQHQLSLPRTLPGKVWSFFACFSLRIGTL